MQIHSIGIDLGKTTFHLVALGAAGKVLVKKKFYTEAAAGLHGQPADFACRPRSLFWSALPWPGTAEARPRCSADRGAVREAFCEDEQERFHRC